MMAPTRLLRLARDGRAIAFLANFGLGKGIAFAGPIVLGAVLSPALYGALEFGLAVSLFAAMVLTAGVPQSAMQLVLMRQGQMVTDLLALVAVAACCIALAVLAGLSLSKAPDQWLLAASLAGIGAAQQSGVAFARAHGWRNLNVWIDHAPTVATVVLAMLLLATGYANNAIALVICFGALSAIIALSAATFFHHTRSPQVLPRWKEAVRVGLPMLGASLAGVWIISSGRIYLGLFRDASDLYAYAFTFRVASVLVLVHALVVTAFAARLYKMPTRQFDRIGSALIALLAFATLVFIVAAPAYYAALWNSPDKATLLAQRPYAILAAVQVFLWVSSAIIEMRVARARLAGQALVATLGISITSAIIVLAQWQRGALSFPVIMIVLVVQQAAALGVQHFVLARRGVPHQRMLLTSACGSMAALVVATVMIANAP